MLYKSMLSEILLLNIRQDADPEHGLGTPTFLVAVQMNQEYYEYCNPLILTKLQYRRLE